MREFDLPSRGFSKQRRANSVLGAMIIIRCVMDL